MRMIEALQMETAQAAVSVSDAEARAQGHRARVAPWAESFLQRRARGEKHPVWDFMFTYYSFSPGKLMKWCPAIIEGKETASWVGLPLTDKDREQAAWIAQLCGNITEKPARFQCHGLHEWAMVYKQTEEQVRHGGYKLRLSPETLASFAAMVYKQTEEQVRHGGYKLRLSPETLASFVESQAICCTHHDAYRFFTPEARPLNAMKPRLETRLDLEQGGCLHTNMDLYKWAYKLWPWIGSDLVADAFQFALGAREMDMRASPYDLADLGFMPIAIETEEGRAEYRAAQQDLAERAAPLRKRLHEAALWLAQR